MHFIDILPIHKYKIPKKCDVYLCILGISPLERKRELIKHSIFAYFQMEAAKSLGHVTSNKVATSSHNLHHGTVSQYFFLKSPLQ